MHHFPPLTLLQTLLPSPLTRLSLPAIFTALLPSAGRTPHVSPSKPTSVAPRTRGRSCPMPGLEVAWGEGPSVPCPSLVKLLVGLWTVWLCQEHPGIPLRCWRQISEGSRGGFCFSPSCDPANKEQFEELFRAEEKGIFGGYLVFRCCVLNATRSEIRSSFLMSYKLV